MTKEELLKRLVQISKTATSDKENAEMMDKLTKEFEIEDFIHIFELAEEGKIEINMIGGEGDTKK